MNEAALAQSKVENETEKYNTIVRLKK